MGRCFNRRGHEPPKRFMDINKNLIVINGNIFEHLAPETMRPAWLYEEMALDDILLSGSQTGVDNMYDVLETETERRLNDDFNAPRMANMLRIYSVSVMPCVPHSPLVRDPRLWGHIVLLVMTPANPLCRL